MRRTTWAELVIALGLVLVVGVGMTAAVRAHSAEGRATRAAHDARLAQLQAAQVTATLQRLVDAGCRNRQANTVNAEERGRVIRELARAVVRPFLLGASDVRLSTAAVQDASGRHAEAQLNRAAAARWRVLAQKALELSQKIRPYDPVTCR